MSTTYLAMIEVGSMHDRSRELVTVHKDKTIGTTTSLINALEAFAGTASFKAFLLDVDDWGGFTIWVKQTMGLHNPLYGRDGNEARLATAVRAIVRKHAPKQYVWVRVIDLDNAKGETVDDDTERLRRRARRRFVQQMDENVGRGLRLIQGGKR